MQGNSFAEVTSDFVESLALSNHGNLEAFGDVPRLIPGPDYGFDRALKGHPLSLLIALVPAHSMLTDSTLLLKQSASATELHTRGIRPRRGVPVIGHGHLGRALPLSLPHSSGSSSLLFRPFRLAEWDLAGGSGSVRAITPAKRCAVLLDLSWPKAIFREADFSGRIPTTAGTICATTTCTEKSE